MNFYENRSSGIAAREASTFSYMPHLHESIELVYVEKGSTEINIEGKTHIVEVDEITNNGATVIEQPEEVVNNTIPEVEESVVEPEIIEEEINNDESVATEESPVESDDEDIVDEEEF